MSKVDPVALATAVAVRPALLDEFPALSDPDLYPGLAGYRLSLADADLGDRLSLLRDEIPDGVRSPLRQLIDAATTPAEFTPISTSAGHSILTSRDGSEESLAPIPAGSVTGSLPEGQTLSVDEPLPPLLE